MSDPHDPIDPVITAPVEANPAAIEAAPVVGETIASEPVIAPVAEPEPSPAEAPKPAVSMLSEAMEKPAPAEAAPVEAKDAPADQAPVAEPEPEAAPTYESFTLPEGAMVDPAEIGKFTEVLGKHKAPQELGQELIDLHVAEVSRLAQSLVQANAAAQQEAWSGLNQTWRDDVLSDPEIGGKRHKTAMNVCGAVIEEYGTPGLRAALDLTGAGNNPEIIRFIHNIGKALGEGRPIPAIKPAPAPSSKAQRRYGANGA